MVFHVSPVLMLSSPVLVALLLMLQNCKLELLTWQQIKVVLSVPVYGINSYLKILIRVGTWLSRAVFCISFSRQVSCTATCETVQRKAGCLGTGGWSDITYLCGALRVPVCYTDVLCLHLKCPQEGGQDCVAPVRIIHCPCGLAWLQ